MQWCRGMELPLMRLPVHPCASLLVATLILRTFSSDLLERNLVGYLRILGIQRRPFDHGDHIPVEIPGRRSSSGMRSAASTISSAPPHRLISSATTASFSTGLKEHVLYTMYPPTLSKAAPRERYEAAAGGDPWQTLVAIRTKFVGFSSTFHHQSTEHRK